MLQRLQQIGLRFERSMWIALYRSALQSGSASLAAFARSAGVLPEAECTEMLRAVRPLLLLNPKLLRQMLAAGLDPNAIVYDDVRLLEHTSHLWEHGDLSAVRLLLDAGASARYVRALTLCHLVRRKRADLLALLLEAGARADDESCGPHKNLKELAVALYHGPTLRVLERYRPGLHVRPITFDRSALEIPDLRSQNPSAVLAWKSREVPSSVRRGSMEPPTVCPAVFEDAVRANNLALVDAFLKVGPIPGCMKNPCTSSLHHAQSKEMLALLISSGASPNGCERGTPPLHRFLGWRRSHGYRPRLESVGRVEYSAIQRELEMAI